MPAWILGFFQVPPHTLKRGPRTDNTAVRHQIWLKFKLIRDIQFDLVTTKNEEDLVKNEASGAATTLNITVIFQKLKNNLQWYDLV